MYKTQVIVVLLVTALLVLGGCTPTQTATEDEVAELQSRITALEKELSAKEATIDTLQQELQEKQSKIEELEEALQKALQESTPTPPLTSEWGTLESEYFVIKYYQGYEDDARETLDVAITVREITLKKYPHELGAKVIIYVYPDRNELLAKEGVPTAVAHTSASGGVFTASISILGPSWEGHWGGYEQLDNPFRRVLNHEYVHVPFYKDLFTKSVGYKDPPSWFAQGIVEYISENYTPSYEKRVRESIQSGSFIIGEPYSWGLYIIEYMYVEYGQEKVVNLIRSDASTFWDALRKEIEVSPSEFEDGWRAYLAEKFGAESR